jgi:hypothetical protein
MLFAAATLIVTDPVRAASPLPTRAVTVAVRLDVNSVVASPLALETGAVEDSAPAVVVNVTGTSRSRLPAASTTVAVSVTFPPETGTFVDDDDSDRLAAMAPPNEI